LKFDRKAADELARHGELPSTTRRRFDALRLKLRAAARAP
jgi:hypothetical protein